ncbi:MAG: GtrA family protein [Candidatus Moranbacteria bacterium]|nr:GtrA family protein [Candidatus Moranbacteria bacterium]MDD3965029.1 GtrA family protein [Candidatus Moranbacteria bacterium]
MLRDILNDPIRLRRIIKQFIKFVIVGGINTGIDFLVLNILMHFTGIASGPELFLLNSISFSVAVFNSYFMNKHWTFQDKTKTEQEPIKFSAFFIISVIGLFLNGLILTSVTTFIPPFFGLSAVLWTNIAKLFATGFSMLWNFVGYKLFVFKK